MCRQTSEELAHILHQQVRCLPSDCHVRRRGRETGNRAGRPARLGKMGQCRRTGSGRGECWTDGSTCARCHHRRRSPPHQWMYQQRASSACGAAFGPRHTTSRVREILCAPARSSVGCADRVVGHAAIVANVCIGGKGPFPFLVDTGGLQLSLIRALRRGFTSPSLTGLGPLCRSPASGSISFTAVTRWSVGNTTLLPQTVEVGTAPVPGPSEPGRGTRLGHTEQLRCGQDRLPPTDPHTRPTKHSPSIRRSRWLGAAHGSCIVGRGHVVRHTDARQGGRRNSSPPATTD